MCITCSGHGSSVFLSNDIKKIYKSSVCDPEGTFPQMIIIPFFEKASQIVPNCQTYPKHKTALALFVFYSKWTEYFGDRDYAVRGMLQRVMIKWDVTKKTSKRGYKLNGEAFEDYIYNSVSMSRMEMDGLQYSMKSFPDMKSYIKNLDLILDKI